MKEIPEELLPVVEWWEKDGKQTVALLVVVALAVAGYYGWKNWKETRRIAAADALVTSYGTEDLEGAVAEFGGTEAGPALKMRLAKNYFDNEKYQEALDVYESLKGNAPDGFEGVPEVGAAESLAALERYDEAIAAYDDFLAKGTNSFLALTARIGAAYALAGKGDKAKALERLEAAKSDLGSDAAALSRIDAAVDFVKRWEKRAAVSLFDAADAAAKKAAADTPTADTPTADTPKADTPKADAPKAAEAKTEPAAK